MRIEATADIAHTPQLVFLTLRDRIHELASIMENVESMDVLERTDDPPFTKQYNRWQGLKGNIPAIARPFVSRDTVAWFDHANWDESKLLCQWRVEPIKDRGIFECHGETTLADNGQGGCKFSLVANLKLHLDKIPGLPKFLARRAEGPVSRYVAKQMRPNFVAISTSVGDFLDQEHAQEKMDDGKQTPS